MTQNKLNKDQVQKLILSAIGFVGLLYVYFSFFLGPLNKSRIAAEKTIHEVEAKIASSKTEISKAANLENQATAATGRFAALQSLSPEGAPIAWFPPRIKLFFANQQIEKATVRLDGSTSFSQPELSQWNRFNWSIELPQTDFATLGRALAELENSEPLLVIPRLTIRATTDNPQFQQVTLTAAAAIMKR